MAIVFTSRTTPRVMSHSARVRNGLEVDHRPLSGVARANNFILQRMRKVVFEKAMNLQSLSQGAAGTLTAWRWYCHTGLASATQGSLKLVCEIGLLPGHTAGTDPKIRLGVDDGVSTTYSDYVRPITSSLITPGLNDISWTSVEVDVTADTDYRCHLECTDYARMAFATCYEVHPKSSNTADSFVSDPTKLFSGNEITDAEHAQILGFEDGGHWMWKRQAAHLFSLVPDWPITSKFTTASTSYVNPLGGSATVSATSRGFQCAVRYHQPAHTNDVVCLFAAYGSQDVGTGGDVTLVDSNGILATLSSWTTTPGWKTATATLSGATALHKVDVQFRASAGNTLTLESACLLEYVA